MYTKAQEAHLISGLQSLTINANRTDIRKEYTLIYIINGKKFSFKRTGKEIIESAVKVAISALDRGMDINPEKFIPRIGRDVHAWVSYNVNKELFNRTYKKLPAYYMNNLKDAKKNKNSLSRKKFDDMVSTLLFLHFSSKYLSELNKNTLIIMCDELNDESNKGVYNKKNEIKLIDYCFMKTWVDK